MTEPEATDPDATPGAAHTPPDTHAPPGSEPGTIADAPAAAAETPVVPAPEVPSPPATPREAELGDRVRRLEAALAERAVAAPGEDELADRVIARLSAIAGESRALATADRVVVLGTDPGPPRGAVLHPPADESRRTWLLPQLLGEIRLAFRMYFDPRYRVSRTTQFVLPGIGLLLVFNYFLFAVWMSVPVLSPVAERVLAVFLGVVGYKLLVRELGRYRDVLAYLARYGGR